MADIPASAVLGTSLKPTRVIVPAGQTTALPTLTTLDPGSLTANVWKEVLNVSTGGIFLGAWVWHGSTASRAVGLRVTLDGVVACTIDETPASTNTLSGVFAGCYPFNDGSGVSFGWALFSSSMKIEVRSSDTNTAVRYAAAYSGN